LLVLVLGSIFSARIFPQLLRPYIFVEGLRTLEGREIKSFGEITDAPVLFIVFWDISCGYCKQQLQDMVAIYPEVKSKYPVEFIAINIGDSERGVRGYVEKMKIPFPVLIGVRRSPVNAVPYSLILIAQPEGGYQKAWEQIGMISGEEILILLSKGK